MVFYVISSILESEKHRPRHLTAEVYKHELREKSGLQLTLKFTIGSREADRRIEVRSTVWSIKLYRGILLLSSTKRNFAGRILYYKGLVFQADEAFTVGPGLRRQGVNMRPYTISSRI